MTCLEAQSNIIAYIENGLDKDKKIEFLKHIQNCNDCKEELDIYYTMIEGMRQMDDNIPLTKDFHQALEERIERDLKQTRKKKEFAAYTFSLILIGIAGFAIIGYINFLNIIHADEQNKLKEMQGEYYYSDTFDDILFEPDANIVSINVDSDDNEGNRTFYSRVREYNAYNK